MTARPVIRLESVSKRFGDVAAVDNVSLDVLENEFLALLGPSGCGKTTLLRAIAGLEAIDAGAITIDGRDMTAAPPYARPVNMMFQSYALFPHMTVAANIAFGLKQDGLRGADLEARVKESLAIVEMAALGERKPHQLSGGQKQRAALARCLAKRPRVLLLDEPMAALDKHLRERTQLELMALRARLGISFVVVTHDQDEAMAMADRVAVMQAGRILQVDTPRRLYDHPGSEAVARFFGDVNLWQGVVTAGGRAVAVAALGAIELALDQTLPAGQRVALALRPEKIVLADAGSALLRGRVADVIYRGTASVYFIRTASDATIRAVQQNAQDGPRFAKGDEVAVSWAPAALQVVTP